MKRTLFFLFLFFFAVSCKKSTVKKFFEYDEIDYYHSGIQQLTPDGLSNGLLSGNTPENLRDMKFLNDMEKIGFKKFIINPSDFDEINEVFREKTTSDNIYSKCTPIYRDVLIFKKEGKISGIAKICFSCNQNMIIGTKASTDNFGQKGDYDRLEKTLAKVRDLH
ncbi:hypothetical protein [Chryseobacterium sp. 2987]|uniref:hypothetical protein n=1 Tax=Chryseobacterium sp. 2987 TaxID=2817767 RepID=UPI0028553670|nr:hypothetical protein [Chryseobacterium sp. 2987]MDR6920614.1 hypothetical protein [Chryseobacterium sp. 2987]